MINSQRQDSCYRVDLQRDQKMNIQELLAGNGPITETAAAAALTAVSSSSSTTPLVSSSSTRSENLRCPRCDSSNTKFCYYNNYNLTQPRHFCKTCRRYWTKGGALRNVPIGGGCRKNKNAVVSSVSLGKSTATKWKSTFLGGLEPENNKTFLFTPSNTHQNNNHHNHHAFLSMLRPGHQNPNPSAAINPGGEVSGLWRNSQHRGQLQNGFVLGDAQNTGGVQELLYQRLIKSTTANNYNNLNCYEQYPLALHGNSNAAASQAILESAPVSAAGEFGYWNPSLSTWSDLPTTGGAYP